MSCALQSKTLQWNHDFSYHGDFHFWQVGLFLNSWTAGQRSVDFSHGDASGDPGSQRRV